MKKKSQTTKLMQNKWCLRVYIYICTHAERERERERHLISRLSVHIFPLDCTSVSFDLCYNGREID